MKVACRTHTGLFHRSSISEDSIMNPRTLIGVSLLSGLSVVFFGMQILMVGPLQGRLQNIQARLDQMDRLIRETAIKAEQLAGFRQPFAAGRGRGGQRQPLTMALTRVGAGELGHVGRQARPFEQLQGFGLDGRLGELGVGETVSLSGPRQLGDHAHPNAGPGPAAGIAAAPTFEGMPPGGSNRISSQLPSESCK